MGFMLKLMGFMLKLMDFLLQQQEKEKDPPNNTASPVYCTRMTAFVFRNVPLKMQK